MLHKWSVVDSLLVDLLGTDWPIGRSPSDVIENDKEFLIELEVPGIHLADIAVGVEGNRLTVKAEQKGFAKRKISETFLLPQGVDSEGISATCDKGILTVTIPKRAGALPRKIVVKTPSS